jgi:hypothetical protein
MSNEPVNKSTGKFTMSDDIFLQPGLDIYTQMAYIILKNFSTESNIPELSDISKLGRMDVKQTMKALQSLVELKLLSHKAFQRMVGDFRDDRLSWAAKGLLVFCKDNPQINFQDLLELASESGEDELSIRKALNELSQYGYLEQYPEWNQIVN